MNTNFKTYRFKKYPITFVYPAYSKYRQFHQKKYSKQIVIREEKDKYGRNERGKVIFIYPKLCITVARTFVPAYQTNSRRAYFMPFESVLQKVVMLDRKKSAFPEMICNHIVVGNFWKGIKTIYRHPKNPYWRTEVYLHEIIDVTNFVNFMYRHIGDGRSDEELETILNSFESVPLA